MATVLFAIEVAGKIITRKPRVMSELAPIAAKMAQDKDTVLKVVRVDSNNQPVAETPSRSVDGKVKNNSLYATSVETFSQNHSAIGEFLPDAVESTRSVTGFVPRPVWKARQNMPLTVDEAAYVCTWAAMVNDGNA